jgi:hypothetical protein
VIIVRPTAWTKKVTGLNVTTIVRVTKSIVSWTAKHTDQIIIPTPTQKIIDIIRTEVTINTAVATTGTSRGMSTKDKAKESTNIKKSLITIEIIGVIANTQGGNIAPISSRVVPHRTPDKSEMVIRHFLSSTPLPLIPNYPSLSITPPLAIAHLGQSPYSAIIC